MSRFRPLSKTQFNAFNHLMWFGPLTKSYLRHNQIDLNTIKSLVRRRIAVHTYVPCPPEARRRGSLELWWITKLGTHMFFETMAEMGSNDE